MVIYQKIKKYLFLCEIKELIVDLVFDHPWLWTGIIFIFGFLLGFKDKK